MTTDKIRKDKNQNIQVFIRLRPLNQRERDIKSLGVIEVANNKEVVVRQSQQTSHTKKFTFDRAFGPSASQLQVYQEVVSPLIEEVLNGYNCTVFAYGQTGTGKTHTMVGEHSGSDTHWQNDPLAGIIPRALSQLFDELRLTNTEYTVRVSYLELYNEELFDLLSTSEDNSKLRIYEDVTRKGSNIVNGLEEITVYNKNEVYKIMAQGQERKRVASTLMNAQSSRSHTVFTIVIHMKENSPEGEELVKIGKLNLVDLAGSENISKAGSDNPAKKERARECVNINQSLLTLGRVITALVERHPHIPYRESKLTRILQESLGGRTKTSIIATISPGHKDLEETMSTLEYAHRAKNIQNKPEVNQKMTKKAILKEYAEEIDRLKRDLQASRDKNGVYLASETYAEMTLKEEEQRKEIQDLLLKKKAMEDERDRMEAVFAELNNTLETRNNELAVTVNKLESTKAELASTSQQLHHTKTVCEEQQLLVQVHKSTETTLSAQARELLATADIVTEHVQCLHDTVDKRKSVESANLDITRSFREQSEQQRADMSAGLDQLALTLTAELDTLQTSLDSYTKSSTEIQEQNKQQLEGLVQIFIDTVNQSKAVAASGHSSLVSSSDSARSWLQARVSERCSSLRSLLQQFLVRLGAALQQARGVGLAAQLDGFVREWYTGAANRVSALQRAHSTFESLAAGARREADAALARQRDLRRGRGDTRARRLLACLAELQEESSRLQQRLTEQLTEIEAERHDTEARLQDWMAEERRLLEERLAKHVANEKNALETRLSKKIAEVEEQKKLLEERMQHYKELYEIQLETDNEESEIAEVDLQECIDQNEKYAQITKKFGKEFEDGTYAISTDMEVFTKNVVDVVEHLNNQMMQVLDEIKTSVENDVNNVTAADDSSCNQFVQTVDEMLVNVVDNTKRVVDELITKIEEAHSVGVEQVRGVATCTAALVRRTREQQAQAQGGGARARAQLAAQLQRLRAALLQHAGLEAQHLTRQYRLYSPTGKTPSRSEYRYPRVLAATSPHDRILARFRAMRQHSDEECIMIESDLEQRQASDSDASASDDSSIFATPSPPADTHNRSANNKIVKCTSETDIYTLKKQNEQGKENAERSISSKKPSKLPAPLSHKKPLVERNDN